MKAEGYDANQMIEDGVIVWFARPYSLAAQEERRWTAAGPPRQRRLAKGFCSSSVSAKTEGHEVS